MQGKSTKVKERGEILQERNRGASQRLVEAYAKAAEITAEEAAKTWVSNRENPDNWVEQILDCQLWEMQRQILRAVVENPRVVVRSAEGTGKTFTAACSVLHFLLHFPPATVLTTAPTFRQVQAILWREIAQRYGRARAVLPGKLTDVKLDIEENWFALGLSTDMPERFQGFHNKNVLVIGDEASGLPVSVYQAIENPLATGNAHLLLIGNPTQEVGPFRDCFSSPLYKKFHITAFDTPNFTQPGVTIANIRDGTWKEKVEKHAVPCSYLVEPARVAERYEEWGEDSYMFQVFVMGEFPEAGVNNLFRLSDIEAAMEREVKPEGDLIAALDVARYGDNLTVLGGRRGNHFYPMLKWSKSEIGHTVGRVLRETEKDKPRMLKVDIGGIGRDDFDLLKREIACELSSYTAGSSAVDKEKFGNRRAELYYRLENLLRSGEIELPKDERLKGQLADIRFRFDPKGRAWIESKEEARARGSRSPDEADVITMLLDIGKKVGGKPKVRYYW